MGEDGRAVAFDMLIEPDAGWALAGGWLDLHFLDNDLLFLDNDLVALV